LHGYVAAVCAACFVGVDFEGLFLGLGGVEEGFGLGRWLVEGGLCRVFWSLTRLNMESMSAGGMVTPSFLMKRKPWVEAASRTFWAVSGEGLEMLMTGIVEFAMFTLVHSGNGYQELCETKSCLETEK
jgi:hypothetical protein